MTIEPKEVLTELAVFATESSMLFTEVLTLETVLVNPESVAENFTSRLLIII